jgi:flagellar hook-associated protein 2
MTTISSLGVGSGIDAESIISALMSAESKPLDLLKTQASSISSKISIWGTVSSHVSALQDAVRDLSSISIWNGVKASSSNESAVTVSSDSGAAAGSHSVEVSTLAKGQTIASSAFTDSTTTLSAGTLTLQLGAWSGTSFTAKSGSNPVSITVAADDSLADIRDSINNADAGVTASVVTDANGARLVLRSDDTGAENGFMLTATEDADDGNAATGLSALGYTANDGTAPMDLSQAAQNAAFKVDGIDLSSASNTVTGALEGVTLTLHEVTTTAVEVSVSTDTEEISTAIDTFVSSFNTLMSYLKSQTKYDEAAKKGAPLQGDAAAVGMISQLRNVLNVDFTGSTTYSRLSDIGITMNKDGTLAKKTSGIEDALGNLGELEKLFAADGTGTTESTGIMQRFYDWTNDVLGEDGSLESKTDGLRATLDRNEDRQDAMETRLEQMEKRLRKQYEALDATMATLSGTSSYVTQMINSLG